MNKKRMFTALRFPEETINQIEHLVDKIKIYDPNARYVTPIKNFHLTLYFIGTMEEKKVELTEQALEAACEEYKKKIGKPIELIFTHFGTFKSGGGKLLYLGIENNSDLTVLANLIREEIKKRGFSVSGNNFKAHITLARKFKGNVSDFDYLSMPDPLICTEATLVWSHRVDDVLTYDNVKSYSFVK